MPMEEVEDYVHSPPPMELAQPPKAGTGFEPASKTSQPRDETDNLKEFDDAQQSRDRNDLDIETTIFLFKVRRKSLDLGLTSTWTSTSHS